MKTNQKTITKFFLIVSVLLFLSPSFTINQSYAQTKNDYKVLDIQMTTGEGKDKEVKVLFEGERRKIAQLTLRNGKNLEGHSAKEPIVIQCVSGEGELIIKNDEESSTIKLLPGTFVTIESNVLHDVIGKPSVSIVLIRFFEEKSNN